MSTPSSSLPGVAKHTHLSVCSHPEYKRKHPLPTHWLLHSQPVSPCKPGLRVWVLTDYCESLQAWGRRGEGAVNDTRMRSGWRHWKPPWEKWIWFNHHTQTHKHTHWPEAIVCCMKTGHVAPTYAVAQVSGQLGDGRHWGLGLVRWRQLSEILHITSARRKRECEWDDCMVSFIKP